MPAPRIKIEMDQGGRIGRGKIELLEHIAELGSISAAGRAMGMSYRRAWELADETNRIFGQAVVERQAGGKGGGGAILTPLGVALVTRFRAIEQAAAKAVRGHVEALQREVRTAD